MLADAIWRAERGLIDADLGGGVIKQRVARPNQGRSGGFRTIVGYRIGERAVFLFGFAKNERENIRPDALENLREIGAAALALNDAGLARAIAEERIEEIDYDEDR